MMTNKHNEIETDDDDSRQLSLILKSFVISEKMKILL